MEQQKQQNNDGDRDPQQPKKNSSAHNVLPVLRGECSPAITSLFRLNVPYDIGLEGVISFQAAVRGHGPKEMCAACATDETFAGQATTQD